MREIFNRRNFLYLALFSFFFASLPYETFVSDHENYLLNYFLHFDNTYALNDWYLTNVKEHHFFFTFVLVLLGNFFDIHISLFLLYLAYLLLLFISVYLILSYFSLGLRETLVSLIVVKLIDGYGWGGVNFLGITSLPHYLSLPIFLICFWSLLTKKPFILFFGLLILFYINTSTGIFSFVFFNMIYIIQFYLNRNFQSYLDLLKSPFTYLNLPLILLIIPINYFTGSQFLFNNAQPDSFRIFFEMRTPHHYIFSYFNKFEHLFTVSLILISLFLLILMNYRAKFFSYLIIYITFLGLSGAFAYHVVFIPQYLRLFPYRLTPILIPITAILITLGLTNRVRKVQMVSFFSLIYLIYLHAISLFFNPLSGTVLILFLASFLVFVLVFQLLVKKQVTFFLFSNLLVILYFTHFLLFASTTHNFQSLSDYDSNNVRFVSKYTNIGDTILVPPDAGEVRFLSGRAIVVDFSGSPLVSGFMEEWKQRIYSASCASVENPKLYGYSLWSYLKDSYSTCDSAELIRIATKFNADFIMLEKSALNTSLEKLIFVKDFGKFNLYAF